MKSVLEQFATRLRRMLLLGLAVVVFFSAGLVLVFRWFDPPSSAVILQRMAADDGPHRQRWVSYDSIDPQLALAVIAAEDQRFPDHWGFDVHEIAAAVERHLDGGPLRGASTITQQVARNLFLWQGRSYVRKLMEAWFTALLELFWSKQRILEVYLNIAEMGPGVYGAAAAGEVYFSRTPGELGDQRAALLAAALPNPHVMRVEHPSHDLERRRTRVLKQMRNLGGIAYLSRLQQGR